MARQDRDSQYGGGSYNSSKNNSGRTQSYGGDNNRENYRNTPAAKASAKKAATISKANKIKNDATAFDNYTYTAPKFAGSILAKALELQVLAEKRIFKQTNHITKKML
jgi:hypothetical protein